MTDDPVQTVARRLRLNQTFFMRNCFDVQTHNTLRDSGLMLLALRFRSKLLPVMEPFLSPYYAFPVSSSSFLPFVRFWLYVASSVSVSRDVFEGHVLWDDCRLLAFESLDYAVAPALGERL